MKKTYFIAFTFLIGLSLFSTGCTDEGLGGNSTLAVHVKHHDQEIPFAVVYIKYGAKESPGTDSLAYDDMLVTDSDGHGHFEELEKGNYYVYSVGFDSSLAAIVTGGIPVKLKANSELETDVPVSE